MGKIEPNRQNGRAILPRVAWADMDMPCWRALPCLRLLPVADNLLAALGGIFSGGGECHLEDACKAWKRKVLFCFLAFHFPGPSPGG